MKFIKEPLFHFLLLAALLFALEHIFSAAEKDEIVIDRQTAEFLIEQREDLELRTLSAEDRAQIIDGYVEDEILYAEAYKRGLDRSDSRMRRNMIRKIRAILMGDLRDPTAEDLRAYYDSHPKEFESPAALTLDHVFFSDAKDVPDGLLGQLRAGANHVGIGEHRMEMGTKITWATERVLSRIFGSESALAVLAINDSQWYGPFESPQGVHFVRITEIRAASYPPYEAVEAYLETQWGISEGRKIVEKELEVIKQGYNIIIEDYSETAE